eukprot:TRINITY_DN17221_c0_g1_i1.p1 TRINITY_DN17221_c0_g1~~TRINITY_DN17221_c0_g1_i1.p1  ORF type:complete len:112 (+),score=16.12 TRINITY_DN17221_c0_g1_i1:227-562(+)
MAQNQAVSFDLYRESSLGKVLIDALDELCNENKLPVDLAVKILKEFDKCFLNSLSECRNRGTLRGKCSNYRLCDGVWTFFLENGTLFLENKSLYMTKVKIVAVDAKLIKQQ